MVVSVVGFKPIAETGNTEQFIANSQALIANNHANIAYVLIENGQVVFQDYSKSKDEITANTLFPVHRSVNLLPPMA